MEDGLNGNLSKSEGSDHVNNGLVTPIMANFSETEEASNKDDTSVKVNGDTEQISNPESYSSESDALIIDESAPTKKKPPNSPKSTEVIPHFNPYFNESLFELSQQHQAEDTQKTNVPQVNFHKHKRLKNKNSPKLREYAQYLGLQPTVQFKCSRCGRAGFESLTTLNEHIVQCTDEPSEEPQIPENSSSSFKLTRKVFLCSACGTYYENWNLYLHMLEVHRRYLCLYCLGMFSVLDDLCLHIQSRHNFEPGYKDSLDDFFSAYSEPCYIVCCECNKLFNEQDNFFYHNCVGRDKNNKAGNVKNANKLPSKTIKQQIRPEDHVTGETLVNGGCLENLNKTTKDSGGKQNNQETTDRQIGESVIVGDKIEEIVYSSDDELDFKGFTEAGRPVHKSNDKSSDTERINSDNTDPPQEIMDEGMEIDEEPVETRKVPKLSLKLKPGAFPQIEQHQDEVEDNDKLENDLEQIESENEINEANDGVENEEQPIENNKEDDPPEMKIAGSDINIIELELEQPLDKFDIRVLLQKCLKATAPFCIYCNHARKIAVNGKELGLHAIAEHRFSAVVHSITAEELIPESFVTRIKESLPELENVFFSLESSPSDEGVTFSHIFECFQCRYSTSVHKELYLHNRKSHAKNLLLCIMCKSNFYSYSELICHLCPGVYILDYDVGFRCCMCVGDDLPSAFRLMVHLRKRHHVCDVCLEMCHNQYRLSNHVWKHKLHHFCYRCGIAYRNKPDITRHLFWKHGTESVLCKKCLQKKWPHVYHFCVPPASFTCEECNLNFSRAVSLKVHKRIHSDEKPHACTVEGCQERFISKKILAKHELKHREPPEEPKEAKQEDAHKENDTIKTEQVEETKEEKIEEKVKPKVDVYDLPELNLSESDSSESEDETDKGKKQQEETNEIVSKPVEKEETVPVSEIEETPVETNEVILEDIWDNFKTYQANKEKFDHMFNEAEKNEETDQPQEKEETLTLAIALMDHDYCIDPDAKTDVTFTEVKPDLSQSVDHDYCSAKDPVASPKPTEEKTVVEEEKKKDKTNSSSSDSSSDSDSSSCSCGPNCSCSSSSGSSSSSSDSSDSDSSTEEGRKRQQLRRDKRRQRKTKEKDAETKVDVVANETNLASVAEVPILESDLETTESETDEEFYDKQPHLLAKKILEEKRNQLLAGIEQAPNGSLLDNSRAATPNLPEEEQQVKKKKSKSKKKKKKKSERREMTKEEFNTPNIPAPYYQYYQPPTVAPITLSLSRNSPLPSPSAKLPSTNVFPQKEAELPPAESDTNLRASKRRRVPNKFYGYSSDEEDEKLTTPKWRKTEPPAAQHSSLMVPPITIKTGPPQNQQFRASYQNKDLQTSRKMPAIKLKAPKVEDGESEVESNDSSNEGRNMLHVNPDALYCYCKCPYDEVSEMIGCDARDCSIEWFHFECVGIMVPPKGHWYCPECRKKRQQKRESLKLKAKS